MYGWVMPGLSLINYRIHEVNFDVANNAVTELHYTVESSKA